MDFKDLLGSFLVFGVKPNPFLIFLAVFSFLTNNFLFFVVAAAIGWLVFWLLTGLIFQPLVIVALGLAIFWLKPYFLWRELLNFSLALFVATFLFYAIIDWSFLIGNPEVVLMEAFYNILIGGALLLILQLWLKNRR